MGVESAVATTNRGSSDATRPTLITASKGLGKVRLAAFPTKKPPNRPAQAPEAAILPFCFRIRPLIRAQALEAQLVIRLGHGRHARWRQRRQNR